jgi:hypothetical protein
VKEEPPDVADEEERDLQTPQPDEEEFRSLGLSLYFFSLSQWCGSGAFRVSGSETFLDSSNSYPYFWKKKRTMTT